MGTPKFAGDDAPIKTDPIIASWGGLDILVDPYTESTSGAVRVTAFHDTDVICRHEQSFARGRFDG